MTTINKLASDLLEIESQKADLCTKVMAIDASLAQRLPTLEKVASMVDDQGQPISVFAMASAIGDEASLLSGSSSRLKNSSAAGDGDSNTGLSLRDDAIRDAVLSKSFTKCVADLETIDISTTEGRKSAMETGFMARNALITKVLLWGVKELGRRHPTLALMLELRGGTSLSGMIDYLYRLHTPWTLRQEKFPSVQSATRWQEKQARKT